MTRLEEKRNSLVMQGSILAIASLIVRLIGLFYRIPLVNILTDEGNGYYSAAYDIYSYLLILSSYGLPAAISKIIAVRMAQKKYKEAHQIFRSSFILAGLIGLTSSLILYFGASWFADFIEMPLASVAIKGLAPALLVFSVMSVFRGYFQGMNTMVPTAISQIIEQIFNAIFSIVLALLFLQRGFEYGAAGSSLGTGIGALAATLFLGYLYFSMRPMIFKKIETDIHADVGKNIVHFWSMLLMTSVPMVIGTSTFHLTNLVDLIMFNKALAYHGYTTLQIATLVGILGGKYKILITLPISIASAMATASIPSITKSLTLGDHKLVAAKVDLAIRSVLMISFPSMVGIFILAKPILELLFKNSNYSNITTSILMLGSVSIVLFGLSTISIGLLQGLGLLRIPVKNSFISMLLKIVFNILVLYVFDWNLYGAVLTNIIFAASSAWLNFRAVRKHLKLVVDLYKTIMAPVIASLIMGGFILVIFKLLMFKLSSNMSTIIILPIAMVIYGISILKLKIFNEDELSSIPFGNKLKRFM